SFRTRGFLQIGYFTCSRERTDYVPPTNNSEHSCGPSWGALDSDLAGEVWSGVTRARTSVQRRLGSAQNLGLDSGCWVGRKASSIPSARAGRTCHGTSSFSEP